jgi:DNA-binding LytR/AlgR family response regulator
MIIFSFDRVVSSLRLISLKFNTRDHKLVTHQTMSDMEKLLPSKQFIRVHKSFIIAVDQIKVIYGNTIELEQGVIPIGSSYKNNVMNLLGR